MKLYTYKISVERVVDGDTIVAMIDLGFHTFIKEHVRLYDVDTPEVFGRYAEPRGKLATEFTDTWLRGDDPDAPFLKGLIMDSRKYDAREKYGRSLGEIFRPNDPISLNQALKNAGHEK